MGAECMQACRARPAYSDPSRALNPHKPHDLMRTHSYARHRSSPIFCVLILYAKWRCP
ncbi:hypothetical protein CBM2606_A30149 [Cupriavidus taiwanensis]|nr:hypothetical protein CBM2606_A30149 [Cupriavidus taiwanensis]